MYQFLSLFFKGIAFGIMMAAVPGPVFFIIVQRTLADGLLIGFLCALGAITADTTYALLAALGMGLIMEFFTDHQVILSLAGGIFLIYLGIRMFLRKITLQTTNVQNTNVGQSWFSIFLLTLANPVTVVAYCIIFASMGLNVAHCTVFSTLILVAGVFTGAALIMLTLLGLMQIFKKKISQKALIIINKATAVLLMIFGLIALTRSVYAYTTKKTFPVDTCNYHIVDAQRQEYHASNRTGRSWTFTAWYPKEHAQPLPVIFFSPAHGTSVESHAAALKKLASKGSFVVGIQHAYINGPITFPTGHTIPVAPKPTNEQELQRETATIQADIQATREFLEHKNTDPQDKLYKKLDLKQFRIIGKDTINT